MTRPEIQRPNQDKPKGVDLRNLFASESIKKRIQQLTSGPDAADRLIRLALLAGTKAPKLALCSEQSLISCILILASLDLEPNSPLGEAYLIPRENREQNSQGQWQTAYEATIQIGYRGFITLASKVEGFRGLTAEAVYEHDLFDHDSGSANFIRHRKLMDGDRGKIIGSYAILHIGEATIYRVLTRNDLERIKEVSTTYTSLKRFSVKPKDGNKEKALAKFNDTPWVAWEDEMSAKSAIRRLLKFAPLGRGLAARRLNAATRADDNLIDMRAVASGANPLEAPTVERIPYDSADIALDELLASGGSEDDYVDAASDEEAQVAQVVQGAQDPPEPKTRPRRTLGE